MEEENQGELIKVAFGGSQGKIPYVQSESQGGKSTQENKRREGMSREGTLNSHVIQK